MENRKRMIKTITAAELINGRTFDRTIIDIRPAEEYKKGSMDAALNIPEDKLVEYLENPEEADMESGTIGEGKAWEEGVNVGKLLAAIPKDKPVWVLCHTGNKSLYVAELLDDAGFDAGSVEGGYRSFLRLSLSMMVMNEEEVAERTKAIERSIITKYRKSILVATARANIVFTSKLAFSSSSSSSLDSLIILIPMIPRRTNAIQWSICVIMDSNWLPRR
jgi:tRNA 2-thiocytidine biosynthesis protein TtcA